MAKAKKAAKAAPKQTERAKVAEELADAEAEKAAGKTEAQQEMKAYHEGEFQTHDPITGEKRDLDAPVNVARLDRGETIEDVVAAQRKAGK